MKLLYTNTLFLIYILNQKYLFLNPEGVLGQNAYLEK